MTCIAYIFSREILAVKFYVFLVLVTVGTSKWLDLVALFQDNARRVYDRGCGANTKFGKFSKLGLAPLLWCIIIVMLITYIHSVISGKLSNIFLFFTHLIFCKMVLPMFPSFQNNMPWIWQHHLGCSHGLEFFLQLLGWSCSINVAGISKKIAFWW